MASDKEIIKYFEEIFSDKDIKHKLKKNRDRYFCPNCGKKKLYDIIPGEFGPNVVCINCKMTWKIINDNG